MAEIQQSADSGGKGGKKRSKKMSTKIDMTPMVDLAFLLLTFFMLTTTFAKPKVMQISMPVKPDKEEEQNELKESDAFTILLGENNKIFYYEGMMSPNTKLEPTDYTATGIRQILLQRRSSRPSTVVMIKAADKANYKNMVDILDEMTITGQKKYALVDISKEDENLIQKSGL